VDTDRLIERGERRRTMPPDLTRRVGEFLIRNSAQRYCDACLATTLSLRNVEQAERATKVLTAGPSFVREEADCGRCSSTRQTTRALWAGV
jgi:hypothetical protein